ncbi:MAG: hypothetical protein ACOVN1_12965 [Limnohabitans sp.]
MTSKMVIALVGLGSGALPHLRSLQILRTALNCDMRLRDNHVLIEFKLIRGQSI